jgi:hypothetical protein
MNKNKQLFSKILSRYGNKPLKLCWASRGSNDVFLETEGRPALFAFYRLDKMDTVVPEMGTLKTLLEEQGETPYQIYLNGHLIYWKPDLRDLYWETKNVIKRLFGKIKT